MIIDVVSGWNQNAGDGSAIWDIADAIAGLSWVGTSPLVRRHTCGTELKLFLIEDSPSEGLRSKRLWIVYSYGCARLWKDIAELKEAHRNLDLIDHLVIIAGVPRLWDGQLEISDENGIWHIDSQIIRAATCFSPRVFCLPQSQPIKNPCTDFRNIFVDDCDHLSIVHAVLPEVLSIAEGLLAAGSPESISSPAAPRP